MNGVKRMKKWIGVLLSALIIAGNYAPQTQAVAALPDAVQVRAGELCQLSVEWPYSLAAADETMQVLSSSDDVLGVIGERRNTSELTVSLFGLPVKKIEMHVQEERVLYPGGENIGAAMNTQGVLVVGISGLTDADSPARVAGLRAGDVILEIDGQTAQSAAHLSELVSRGGESPLNVRFTRNGVAKETSLTPAKDALDGRYRLGLWVRDSTAGVGTLSFYDPQTKSYGALGHAVTDLDTEIILPIREGTILRSNVVGIRKGERGNPGELQGTFLRDRAEIGDIRSNTEFGIFGKASEPLTNPLYPDGLPVGSRTTVHTGPAKILTTLDDTGIHEYDVEITRVAQQENASQKSMTLRVTDPVLLEKTGGIVQGMSGSPILQDGRIIGAVTHVFVNNPTQGYGVFIDWMLEQADAV